jgi:uncharacterized protein YdaU (DUF1376 family)
VNYYEHHIGDYAEATAHLTFVEDAAYSRLIRKYYATEKPLPADIKAVQSIIEARSKGERKAVETILNEFFELLDDGWHDQRCDEEITKYQKKQKSLRDLRDGDSYRQHREFVLERDEYKCVYCGNSGIRLQLDHVMPRSRGGSDDPDNLAACCMPCNTSKGSKTPDEWRSKK